MVKNKPINLIFLFFIYLCFISLSNATSHFSSFMPENNKHISIFEKNRSYISEKDFKNILGKVQEIYSPIFEENNARLLMQKRWHSDKVNAYTYKQGLYRIVTIYGGLARHPKMTRDGLALIACHEIGHHLGGLPKKRVPFSSIWVTAEGQADYFAALKCIRKYFEDDDNISIVSRMTIDPVASSKCSRVHLHPQDIAICKRSAMAGLAAINTLSAAHDLPTTSSFSTPSTKVVRRTIYSKYPTSQCRLDTYLAGALCIISANENISETDIDIGVCTRDEGLDIGARPLCWYKP